MLFIGLLQYAAQFTSILGQHFYLLTNVVHVLLKHLERLSDTGRAYFQFEILRVAVQAGFDIAAQLHTIFYPNTVFVVDLHHNLVIRTHRYLHQEVIFVLQPIFYNFTNRFFLYHINRIRIKKRSLIAPPPFIRFRLQRYK